MTRSFDYAGSMIGWWRALSRRLCPAPLDQDLAPVDTLRHYSGSRYPGGIAVIRAALLCASVCAVLFMLPGRAAADPPPGRPNIVVFYMDDVAPHDGRLWAGGTDPAPVNDPARTPNIYNYFVQ